MTALLVLLCIVTFVFVKDIPPPVFVSLLVLTLIAALAEQAGD